MQKGSPLDDVKIGLIIAGAILLFGIVLGIGFGTFEGSIKGFIGSVVDANALVHTEPLDQAKSQIFRWWQRGHFHAMGLSAVTLVLISITGLSSMTPRAKRLCSLLIGLGGVYSLSWFVMALRGASVGRHVAHEYLPVVLLVYLGVGCLLAGFLLLALNLVFGFFSERKHVI